MSSEQRIRRALGLRPSTGKIKLFKASDKAPKAGSAGWYYKAPQQADWFFLGRTSDAVVCRAKKYCAACLSGGPIEVDSPDEELAIGPAEAPRPSGDRKASEDEPVAEAEARKRGRPPKSEADKDARPNKPAIKAEAHDAPVASRRVQSQRTEKRKRQAERELPDLPPDDHLLLSVPIQQWSTAARTSLRIVSAVDSRPVIWLFWRYKMHTVLSNAFARIVARDCVRIGLPVTVEGSSGKAPEHLAVWRAFLSSPPPEEAYARRPESTTPLDAHPPTRLGDYHQFDAVAESQAQRKQVTPWTVGSWRVLREGHRGRTIEQLRFLDAGHVNVVRSAKPNAEMVAALEKGKNQFPITVVTDQKGELFAALEDEGIQVLSCRAAGLPVLAWVSDAVRVPVGPMALRRSRVNADLTFELVSPRGSERVLELSLLTRLEWFADFVPPTAEQGYRDGDRVVVYLNDQPRTGVIKGPHFGALKILIDANRTERVSKSLRVQASEVMILPGGSGTGPEVPGKRDAPLPPRQGQSLPAYSATIERQILEVAGGFQGLDAGKLAALLRQMETPEDVAQLTAMVVRQRPELGDVIGELLALELAPLTQGQTGDRVLAATAKALELATEDQEQGPKAQAERTQWASAAAHVARNSAMSAPAILRTLAHLRARNMTRGVGPRVQEIVSALSLGTLPRDSREGSPGAAEKASLRVVGRWMLDQHGTIDGKGGTTYQVTKVELTRPDGSVAIGWVRAGLKGDTFMMTANERLALNRGRSIPKSLQQVLYLAAEDGDWKQIAALVQAKEDENASAAKVKPRPVLTNARWTIKSAPAAVAHHEQKERDDRARWQGGQEAAAARRSSPLSEQPPAKKKDTPPAAPAPQAKAKPAPLEQPPSKERVTPAAAQPEPPRKSESPPGPQRTIMGVGDYEIYLEAVPNADPSETSKEGGKRLAKLRLKGGWVGVNTLEAAREMLAAFVAEHQLGSGNFSAETGRVRGYGAPLAKIGYDGRIFQVDENWQTSTELLPVARTQAQKEPAAQDARPKPLFEINQKVEVPGEPVTGTIWQVGEYDDFGGFRRYVVKDVRDRAKVWRNEPGLRAFPFDPNATLEAREARLARQLAPARSLNQKAEQIFLGLVAGLDVSEGRIIDRHKGFMAVRITRLSPHWYSVAHRYEQNGDLVSDPDMEFIVAKGKVYPAQIEHNHKLTRAVELDAEGDIGTIHLGEQRSQAEFASKWMLNIEEQQDLKAKPLLLDEGTTRKKQAAETTAAASESSGDGWVKADSIKDDADFPSWKLLYLLNGVETWAGAVRLKDGRWAIVTPRVPGQAYMETFDLPRMPVAKLAAAILARVSVELGTKKTPATTQFVRMDREAQSNGEVYAPHLNGPTVPATPQKARKDWPAEFTLEGGISAGRVSARLLLDDAPGGEWHLVAVNPDTGAESRADFAQGNGSIQFQAQGWGWGTLLRIYDPSDDGLEWWGYPTAVSGSALSLEFLRDRERAQRRAANQVVEQQTLKLADLEDLIASETRREANGVAPSLTAYWTTYRELLQKKLDSIISPEKQAQQRDESAGFATADRLLRAGPLTPLRARYFEQLWSREKDRWHEGALSALEKWRNQKPEPSQARSDGRQSAQTKEKRIARFIEAAERQEKEAERRLGMGAGLTPTRKRNEEREHNLKEAEKHQQVARLFRRIAADLEGDCDPPIGTFDRCLPDDLAELDGPAMVERIYRFEHYPKPNVTPSKVNAVIGIVMKSERAKEDLPFLRSLLKTCEDRSEYAYCALALSGEEMQRAVDIGRFAKKQPGADKSKVEDFIEGINESLRLWKAGITDAERYKQARDKLWALVPARGETPKEHKIRTLMGQIALGGIPGYFPTMPGLADRVVGEAQPRAGERILEPSAGSGAIADAVRRAGFEPEVVERNFTLREILTLKGYKVIADDFMALPVEPSFDVIVGNPPFEDRTDQKHLRRAFELLKPGGRVSFIMSAGAFANSRPSDRAFRSWFDEVGGREEDLPEGSFRLSQPSTLVPTKLVVIQKDSAPETKTSKPESETVVSPSPAPSKAEPKPLGTPPPPQQLPPLPQGIYVALEAQPNEDFESGTRQGSVSIPLAWKSVASLGEAVDAVDRFIKQNQLGGGNFVGSAGHVLKDGQPWAKVSYNRRVWEGWDWNAKQELDRNGNRIPAASEQEPAGTNARGELPAEDKATAGTKRPTVPQLPPPLPMSAYVKAKPEEEKPKDDDWLTNPKCSLCRKPRGSNKDCEKCEASRRMLQERDNPTPEQRADKERFDAEFAASETAKKAAEAERVRRLSGRRIRVALVGCGKSKLDREAKAKDLYTGNLFQAARAYAERCFDEWLILSAGHGVVEPETMLVPYDRTLKDMGVSEVEQYQRTVRSWLDQHYRGLDVEFHGLAAMDYLGGLGGLNLRLPLDGMGIGQRLAWLKQAAASCDPTKGAPKTTDQEVQAKIGAEFDAALAEEQAEEAAAEPTAAISNQDERSEQEGRAKSLVGKIQAWMDKDTFTRGTDYLRVLLRQEPLEELEKARQWVERSGSNWLRKFGLSEIAAELRGRSRAELAVSAELSTQLESLVEEGEAFFLHVADSSNSRKSLLIQPDYDKFWVTAGNAPTESVPAGGTAELLRQLGSRYFRDGGQVLSVRAQVDEEESEDAPEPPPKTTGRQAAASGGVFEEAAKTSPELALILEMRKATDGR